MTLSMVRAKLFAVRAWNTNARRSNGTVTVRISGVIARMDCVLDFLRGIGLAVSIGEIEGPTVLPGIRVVAGGLVVDPARLKHPGDLLHEAGHLAVMPAER